METPGAAFVTMPMPFPPIVSSARFYVFSSLGMISDLMAGQRRFDVVLPRTMESVTHHLHAEGLGVKALIRDCPQLDCVTLFLMRASL